MTSHVPEVQHFFEEDPDVYVPEPIDTADEGPRLRSVSQPASVHYVNQAGIPEDAVELLKGNTEIASIIERWSQSLSSAMDQPSIDVFNRRRWNGAGHIHAQMSLCAWAVENDDICSTAADVIEGLMWKKCGFELDDDDEEDVWNQWAKTVNLDARLREISRELLKVSQVYVGLWWESKTFTVRTSNTEDIVEEYESDRIALDHKRAQRQREREAALNPDVELPEIKDLPQTSKRGGNRNRRKQFTLRVPTAMTVLDPTKVIPVGSLMFGRERFAYVADHGEHEGFASAMAGQVVDPMVMKMVERRYAPTPSERQHCADLGLAPDRLWLLREEAVFRHHLTKSQYERYAAVRLKSILPLIEMKQHLRNSDRAALIGNANFIVVITKGSDKIPAKAAEIANLQEQARVIARLPVMVGDHRLKVEIVAPAIDHTLSEARHQVIDSRLVFKMLGSYSPVVQGGNSSGTGVSEMSRVIANGMESRRQMIVRSLEANVFEKILEVNDGELSEGPTLAFRPKRITLDFSADIMQQILKLRDRGDISRETTLEELDFDQDTEMRRRARERLVHDRIFESNTPYSSPLSNPYGAQPPPQPGQPGQPGQPPRPGQPGQGPPGSNVGPSGQPRTEGGRPPGQRDTRQRRRRGQEADAAEEEDVD